MIVLTFKRKSYDPSAIVCFVFLSTSTLIGSRHTENIIVTHDSLVNHPPPGPLQQDKGLGGGEGPAEWTMQQHRVKIHLAWVRRHFPSQGEVFPQQHAHDGLQHETTTWP